MKMNKSHQNPSALAYTDNRFQFCGDRVELIEWWSILNGISQDQSLPKILVCSRWYRKKVREQINSEEKLNQFWRRKGNKFHPVLFTNYLLRCLMDALAKNLKDSRILSVLILDGIPLSDKYLEILCLGLSCNTNLRTLSLARCRIGDSGCRLVLRSLENNLNLQKLNFTRCNLTGSSGYSLFLFLQKRRQILLKIEWSECAGSNRSSDLLQARGLRTLILNNNPDFSDSGLRLLVDILKQDFWLRVLNIRSCGLSDKGEAILELLRINCTIVNLDFRENNIPSKISEVVRKLLKRRKKEGATASLKKILLPKNISVNEEMKIRRSNKIPKRSKGNLLKHRTPKKKKDSTLREKRKLNSTNNFNKRPKPISKNNQLKKKSINVSSKIISENRKANFMELKLCLLNIVDKNQRLSQHLQIEREVLEKEKKSRLKIEKCCDKIEPEIASICRGILARIEGESLQI